MNYFVANEVKRVFTPEQLPIYIIKPSLQKRKHCDDWVNESIKVGLIEQTSTVCLAALILA